MKTCVLCGMTGGESLELNSGRDLGPAHRGLCAGLVWQAHSDGLVGATDDERALTAWEWARQAARMRGESFDTEPPQSASERELRKLEVLMALA